MGEEIDIKALDESIVKWEAIVDQYIKDNRLVNFMRWARLTEVSTGLLYTDCPLCALYYRGRCRGCPLDIVGQGCGAEDSIWNEYDSNPCLLTATAMLNQLKLLREKYDPQK